MNAQTKPFSFLWFRNKAPPNAASQWTVRGPLLTENTGVHNNSPPPSPLLLLTRAAVEEPNVLWHVQILGPDGRAPTLALCHVCTPAVSTFSQNWSFLLDLRGSSTTLHCHLVELRGNWLLPWWGGEEVWEREGRASELVYKWHLFLIKSSTCWSTLSGEGLASTVTQAGSSILL